MHSLRQQRCRSRKCSLVRRVPCARSHASRERQHVGAGLHLLVRPKVGRMPTRLQWDAGPRTEFPVSVPIPTNARFAATAARRLYSQATLFCFVTWALQDGLESRKAQTANKCCRSLCSGLAAKGLKGQDCMLPQ